MTGGVGALQSEIKHPIDRSVTSTVTVIGAGVAGLAASCALAEAGYDVTLLERRPYVGGRAYSYEHPALHEVVDCQHVLLGCCTNLIHLLESSSVADKVRWYDDFIFMEPGGRRSSFHPNHLPAPLHFGEAFLRTPTLGAADKLAIARGMSDFLSVTDGDDDISMQQWLERTRQPERAIRHFWEPVVLVTMNDSFANCSLRLGKKVFRELFLKSRIGARLGIPTIPLGDLYAAAARRLESLGGKLCLRSGVEKISREASGRWTLHTSTGEKSVDRVLLALPFEQTEKLIGGLPETEGSAELHRELTRFIHSPYTTVHLWFDRQITDVDHAALLDTTIQWMFHKSRIRSYPEQRGSYVELVIAASMKQLTMERSEIIDSALAELATFFPEVRKANVIKSGILKEARSTFSVLPGLDKLRPQARSPWPGIYLAGDWVSTGWPSTMESAARSGYLAAEAISADLGNATQFLQPDLAPSGLMKIFG